MLLRTTFPSETTGAAKNRKTSSPFSRSAGTRKTNNLAGRFSPSFVVTCPLNDAAPAASVMTSPDSRSPDFNVIQLRAASLKRFGCAGVPAGAPDDQEIDRRYQYFAKNRAIRRYWPGARFRNV